MAPRRIEPVKPEGKVHIHRVVTDMKESIDFYTTVLGFFYDHGIKEMAWLKLEAKLVLTLSPGLNPGPESAATGGQFGYLGFILDSPEELAETYEQLYSKGLPLSGPPETDGGPVQFYLYDPDGYPISFSYIRMDY